jgi:hypothetical protein
MLTGMTGLSVESMSVTWQTVEKVCLIGKCSGRIEDAAIAWLESTPRIRFAGRTGRNSRPVVAREQDTGRLDALDLPEESALS